MGRDQQGRTGAGAGAAKVIAALFFLASSGGGGGMGGSLTAIMPGVKGDNYCDSVPAASTAGNVDMVSDFTDEHDFACEDGYFLEGVTVWSDVFVEAMVWRCSNGDESETTEFSDPDGDASFTDGAITSIEAAAHTNTTDLEFLGLMYVGGISPDAAGSDVYSEEGPFGSSEDGNYATTVSSTSCEDGAYATGVRLWHTDSAVYAIMLQCAELTETCAPGVAAADAAEDASGGDGDSSNISGGVIIGIVAAGVWLLTTIGIAVWCCYYRKTGSADDGKETEGNGEEKQQEAATGVI
ncbi:unnamed protein product [Scytosiphon promiscuus]